MDDIVSPEASGNPLKIISRAEAKALGLKTYISGFPCTAGHRAEKFVSDSRCVVCAGENASTVQNWTAPPVRTREERLAYQATYGAKHREEIRVKANAKYRAVHPKKPKQTEEEKREGRRREL